MHRLASPDKTEDPRKGGPCGGLQTHYSAGARGGLGGEGAPVLRLQLYPQRFPKLYRIGHFDGSASGCGYLSGDRRGDRHGDGGVVWTYIPSSLRRFCFIACGSSAVMPTASISIRRERSSCRARAAVCNVQVPRQGISRSGRSPLWFAMAMRQSLNSGQKAVMSC